MGEKETATGAELVERAGPVRLDPTPARAGVAGTLDPELASEVARQTPKRDFGDRMKAGLDTASVIDEASEAKVVEKATSGLKDTLKTQV